MDEARTRLAKMIEERGDDYAALSRLIGRNAAYVQQYIKRGTPRRLAEQDRRLLAQYFGVAEEELGGLAAGRVGEDVIEVPQLDIRAAAGAGALSGDEKPRAQMAFTARWLRRMTSGDLTRLSIVRVEGDSMYPTLAHRDEILVDRGDGGDRLRDGIYVLRRDDALLVKRLALNPASRRISIKSDNGVYPSWPDCDPGAIEIVGRVIWAGRMIA